MKPQTFKVSLLLRSGNPYLITYVSDIHQARELIASAERGIIENQNNILIQ